MAPKKEASDHKGLDILIRKWENERKRLEEIKSDPVLAAKLKENERLKYLKKKEIGKIKLISKLSARDQRMQRKQWRVNNNKKKSHASKKIIIEHDHR
ncbi:hypothetical protein AVEN_123051-1 [Araneus ventricosus]|uniref:Uncharacterized protein n=1 Tax=Araneus ventricosus TaxID=182803 RepID=A0A4Y2MG73_ARAVE|nr:hypothetical protein AVEN_123051-1 [Araneus ventricosus]